MAGGGLEGGRGEADQIEPGHHRGQVAEPALERRRQVVVEGLLPIDVAGKSGSERGNEGERGRGRGDGHGEPRDPFDAAEIHEAEQADDGDGDGFDRKPRAQYHCWMAEAESSAVSPQVGTQPHQ